MCDGNDFRYKGRGKGSRRNVHGTQEYMGEVAATYICTYMKSPTSRSLEQESTTPSIRTLNILAPLYQFERLLSFLRLVPIGDQSFDVDLAGGDEVDGGWEDRSVHVVLGKRAIVWWSRSEHHAPAEMVVSIPAVFAATAGNSWLHSHTITYLSDNA